MSAGVTRWLGETVVKGTTACAGHVNLQSIKNACAVFALVKPFIEQLAQKTPALRRAKTVGAINVERIVALYVGNKVARHRQTDPHNRGLAGRIDEIVDKTGLKTHVIPNSRATILEPRKRPRLARDRLGRIVGTASHAHLCPSSAASSHFVGAVVTRTQRVHGERFVHYDLTADGAFRCDRWRIQRHQVRIVGRIGRHVRLPSTGSHGETALHQQTVAKFVRRLRAVRSGR